MKLAWGLGLASSFVCACTIVIGDIPEGSDPAPSGGSGGMGGVAGSGGTTVQDGSGGTQPEDSAPEAEASSDVVIESSGSDAPPDAPPDSGCVTACDCDGDTHLAEGSCGGTDCDDADPEVFLGQSKFFSTPRADGTFDYDCDDTETADNPSAQCAGTACVTNKPGLFGAPQCGTEQQWAVCTAGTLGCSVTPTQTKVPVLCH